MRLLVGPHGRRRNGIGVEGNVLKVRPGRTAEEVKAHGRRDRHGGGEGRLPRRHVVLRREHVELRERALHRHVVLLRVRGHIDGGVEGVQRCIVGLHAALAGERGHVVVGKGQVIGAFMHGEENHLVVLFPGQGQDDADILGGHRLHGLVARSSDLGSGEQGSVRLGEHGHIELEITRRVVEIRSLRGSFGQGIPEHDGEAHRDRLAAQHRIRHRRYVLNAGSQGQARRGSQQKVEKLFHYHRVLSILHSTPM